MLAGYKTYIVAGLAIITAVSAWLTGDATLAEAIQLCVTSALGATIRHGITTSK